ncbi:sodium:glutamate symporter [Virgibacillus sp. MSJ-26]|uniref:sodium/glutamate symporter n=1 Tax=Virgibacillus sp. MSJ-26 TaxID=2841522 RepID=UPI001C0FBC07|nr:sodium/glutamate symporter [Virgibacillus sp. MSJ-26]MBU5467323.1 sodium:glutamate symporter [Virgibacillus sp. MSJ-26]
MSPDQIGFALLYLGIFILIGKWLRVKVTWMQNLFLPSSMIAGFIALLLGPQVLGKLIGLWAEEGSLLTSGALPDTIITVWDKLPGLMINIVFATLFLGKQIPSKKDVLDYGGPQLAYGWTVGWGQYVIGILLMVLFITPVFGLPSMAGALIEIAFEGGHGTAAGLQGTFKKLGFEEGYDLAIGLATIGVLTGVIVGIILINWGVRKQKTKVIRDVKGFSKLRKQGIMEYENREPAAELTVRPESIEPMSLHFALVGLAVIIGYIILQVLIWIESVTWGAWTGTEIMTYIPLFPLAMIGGITLQYILSKVDREHILDWKMINRIQGFALDVLILTAIGTVSLDIIGQYIIPFLTLALAGIVWNVFTFMFLAKRMIPEYWFERGIGDFGQSTGITATGLLLMRVVDPENKSPAFEAFGYKQLVYEPFLGGGLVTALSVPILYNFGPYPFLIFSAVMSVIGLVVGLFYYGKKR